MDGVILVLGSPNDEQGNLSSIAVERLTQAIKEYTSRPGFKILLTGGWGDHFNRAPKPHAEYAKGFLVQHGIPEADILEFALSSSTIEDATLSKSILERHGVKKVVMVSSEFHMERVKLIFSQALKGCNLEFVGSATNLPMEKMDALLAHERRMMEEMRNEGGRLA